MTESITEYGVRYLTDEEPIRWPDSDGEIYVAGDYYAATPEALTDAVRGLDAEVVVRTYTIETYAPPVVLPTTPGSVVQALYEGEPVVAVLTLDTDGLPWRCNGADGGSHGWRSFDDLTATAVLLDAGAGK